MFQAARSDCPIDRARALQQRDAKRLATHEVISAVDDTLPLLFLCCHPELTAPSQVALTLRAVGGLTTAEVTLGLLVPEATAAQRISRAKARIKGTGAQFHTPTDIENDPRLPAVLRVLYLIFNEGYTASSGASLQRVELTTEAMRLTRQLRARCYPTTARPVDCWH